jgi:hypothetical protein
MREGRAGAVRPVARSGVLGVRTYHPARAHPSLCSHRTCDP